jgi:hypothetical protein
MRIGALIVVLTVALAVVSCKKKDEAAGGGGPAPVAESPAPDCAVLLPKIAECADKFYAAFAETRQAKTTGGDDGAKGAGVWRNMLSPEGGTAEQVCKDNWTQKDPRWNARYNACWDGNEACDVWGPCMADALGNLLPVPQ